MSSSSNESASHPSARAIRLGFGLLVAALAMMAVVKTLRHDTLDPDALWHLRVAEHLAALPYPHPIVDDLSFSSVRQPWTPYSWLAELAMRAIWHLGGYRAALLVQVAMEAAIVVFIALAALQVSNAACGEPRHLASAVAAFAGGFIALPYLSFRPVTFALLFLAVSAWILLRDRRLQERTAAPWLLIPLTALLTNCHLYAAFIPAALFALVAGAWWERRHPAPQLDPRDARRRFKRYTILTVATAGAFLATPMLPGMLAQAWRYQFADLLVRSGVISEMTPFYRGTPLAWVAVSFVVATLACAVWQRRRLRAGELLWVAGAFLVMLRLGRFAPIFSIFAIPTLAATAPRLRDNVLATWVAHLTLAAFLITSAIRTFCVFPPVTMPMATWLNRLEADDIGYPTAAADFVANHMHARTHRLINELTWGGFLEWRLGDAYKVLLDGRSQLFPSEFWNRTYLGTPDQREAFLATISADAAILPNKGSIFHDALLGLGWKPVFTDKLSEVLVPANQDMANLRPVPQPILQEAGRAEPPFRTGG